MAGASGCCVRLCALCLVCAHLAVWPELKLQKLVPIFACVAYVVSQVELVCCHLLLLLLLERSGRGGRDTALTRTLAVEFA